MTSILLSTSDNKVFEEINSTNINIKQNQENLISSNVANFISDKLIEKIKEELSKVSSKELIISEKG